MTETQKAEMIARIVGVAGAPAVAAMLDALVYVAGSVGARDHEREIARGALVEVERLAFPAVIVGVDLAAGPDQTVVAFSEDFQTRDGEAAAHALDGEWLQPSTNPFGHGCCDCGLYHDVAFRLVDENGEGENFFRNQIESGALNLQLCFTRNEEETARLRAHQAANGKPGGPANNEDGADDLDFHCPECGSFDVEEIGYEDDFGSMQCRACSYVGDPGEDFPSKRRG